VPNPPAPDSRRSWFLLSTLIAGYIGVYLCRKNFSVAVPLLRAEFHSTKEEIGRIASVGTFAYACGKMVLCPLADAFGGRRCFMGALFLVSVFGMASGFAPSLGVLAVLYGLNRFGAAPAWASMIKQIPPWFGARNLALAMAVLSLSYVFGGAAAVSLAGQVSEWSGQSWRVIMGAPSLILLLLLGACAAVLPRDHGADRHAEDPNEPRSGFSWALLGELLKLRVFWILCALSFTLTLLRETFNDWAVDFIKTSGGAQLSVRVAAFLSTPFDICGAAGIIFIGVMMGRLTGRARSWLLAGSLLSLFVILVLLPVLVPLGLYAIVPAVGAVGFLSLGPYSLMAGYFAVQLRGPQCAGTISGIVDSVGYFAGVLAGSAFGWLLDHGGYTLGFHVLAGLSLASAVLVLFLRVNPRTSPQS
jgi:sugar phosphate permease